MSSKKLIPLIDKKPIVKDWMNWDGDISQYVGCNVGWVLTHEDLVVDIDPRNGGSIDEFNEWYGESVDASVKTQGGGFHIYFKKNKHTYIPKYNGDLKGIEFLSYGQFVVVPPSANYVQLRGGVYTLNEKLLEGVIAKSKSEAERRCKIDEYKNLSKKEVLELFNQINPDVDYHDWIKCGMALFNWSETDGFEIWKSWSAKGEKFKDGECEKRWGTFKNEYPISLGSVYRTFKIRYSKQLSESDISEMCKEIIPTDKLEYMKYYVYHIQHNNKFYDYRTQHFFNTESFTIEYTKHMPLNEKGKLKKPIDYFMLNLDNSVSNVVFNPREKAIFYENDARYINSFLKSKISRVATEYTNQEQDYINRLDCHFKFLFDDDYNLGIQFLAHIVKYPDRKIPFMMIIQGIQGIGKTFISTMMRALMYYTRTIDSTTLENTYNEYIENTLILFIEELRISGVNRKRVQTLLKPLITNDYVSINKKYNSIYNSQNFANMIAFTNESNPIVVDDKDRRYFVISNPLTNIKDMPNLYGCDFKGEKNCRVKDLDGYFSELFEGIKKYPEAIMKYFHDIDTTEMETLNRAPYNESKKEMIQKEKDSIEGYAEFVKFLDNNPNNKFITKDIIVYSKFKEEMSLLGYHNFKPHNLCSILKACDYFQYTRMRLNGAREILYVHNSLTETETDLAVKGLKKAYDDIKPRR